MQISQNSVVTISLVVTLENGQVAGKTEKDHPKVVLMGHHNLVPGLEAALLGHKKGDEFTVTLEPKLAYGEYEDDLVQTIDRRMFGDYEIEVGTVFEAETSRGICAVVVKEISDDFVKVDGNHPLAGHTVNCIVVVEDVREATQEELAHGHAHVDGVCPSEHHCCCGGHGHHHHDEEGEHHCCCGGHGHHHEEDGEHHCCCGGHGHHHEEDGEHKCCGGHGHHHEEDGEHKCCGVHGHHHHDEEEGEHHCCCGGHGHHHDK